MASSDFGSDNPNLDDFSNPARKPKRAPEPRHVEGLAVFAVEVVLGLALLSGGLGFVEAVGRDEATLSSKWVPVQLARRHSFGLRVNGGELRFGLRFPGWNQAPFQCDQFPASFSVTAQE